MKDFLAVALVTLVAVSALMLDSGPTGAAVHENTRDTQLGYSLGSQASETGDCTSCADLCPQDATCVRWCEMRCLQLA